MKNIVKEIMPSQKEKVRFIKKITPTKVSYETDIKPEYYELVQKELIIRRKQLQTIITNPTSLGNYYEQLVRETISKFIPNNYSLASGIIVGKSESSQQIDIIIYDNTLSYPYFKSENMIVINPDPVRIIIEVKGVLNKSSMNMGKDNLNNADKIFLNNQHTILKYYKRKYLKVLFGFSSNRSYNNLKEWANNENIDYLVVLSKRDNEYPQEFKNLIMTINNWLINNKNKLYKISD